jgi:hypothetical protein
MIAFDSDLMHVGGFFLGFLHQLIDSRDITGILLNVELNTINLAPFI